MNRHLGRVQTRIWRLAELDGAEFLRGHFSGYAYDVHTHDKVCMALITRGAIRIRMRTSEFVARAGDLYAIDAEEPHAGWPIDGDGWSLRTLYVGVDRLQRIVREGASSQPSIAGPIIRDPRLAALFMELHDASERANADLGQEANGQHPPAGDALAHDERCLAFVARLFARHMHVVPLAAMGGREDEAIRRARAFIDDAVECRLRLADIAAVAGLPPYRLFRAFAKTTGMTPHAYQRQARLRLATQLIRSGLSLGEVAAASGFADQGHLTRSFRHSMGITPGAYRAIYRSAA
jgi:AraC-like DNA-binding protein